MGGVARPAGATSGKHVLADTRTPPAMGPGLCPDILPISVRKTLSVNSCIGQLEQEGLSAMLDLD